MERLTRSLLYSRVLLGAPEIYFIDICVVRGMFCLVDGRFYSLFTMAGDAKVSQNTWVPMAGDARGRPGAVQTGVLTAHPESAPDGPFER